MRSRPVPSQLDQVVPRFSVQEAGADHATGRIRPGPFGKGVAAGYSGSRGISQLGLVSRHRSESTASGFRDVRAARIWAAQIGAGSLKLGSLSNTNRENADFAF